MVSLNIFSTIGNQQISHRVHQIGLVELIREGLPPDNAFLIQKTAGLSNHELEKIAGTSYRTLRRNLDKKTRLSTVVSDRIVRFLKVLKDASDTLGGIENASAWIRRPCRPLGDQNPIDLLDTEAGTSEVVDVLGRIRHGVFS